MSHPPISTSHQAAIDLHRAEAELARTPVDGLCFSSVKHALRFYFERSTAMQGALGCHPRGELGPDGQRHYISVDGGKGGDIDDVLATLQTIHDAMVDLRLDLPVAHQCLVLSKRDGLSQAEIAKRAQRSQSQISAELGRAEAFLLALLRRAEVLTRSPRAAGAEIR